MKLQTNHKIDCRLCRDSIFGGPRLTFDSAPSGAQEFGTSSEEALDFAIELSIVVCPSCGLVQSESPPVTYYRQAITAAGVSPTMRAHRLAQAKRLAAIVENPPSNLAIVGCGSGYELPILAEAGFDPVGIEWGGAPAGYQGRYPILDLYPSATAFPSETFGAFACFNFLEHAPEPREFLAAIRKCLTPGAVGVIEVPNYAKQRRDGRVSAYVADHLSYFEERTLRAMLTVSGFEVLFTNEVRDGENLEAIVRPMSLAKLDVEKTLLTSAKKAISNFFVSSRVAGVQALVWGASHEALTLLCGISTEDRPVAIIDSAPFKQGLFAPATGIPIIAPSSEAVANVGSVLIIAHGYESEIMLTLRERFGFTGEIWTAGAHGVEKIG